MGYEKYSRDQILANFMTKFYLEEVETKFAIKVICGMLFYGDALDSL